MMIHLPSASVWGLLVTTTLVNSLFCIPQAAGSNGSAETPKAVAPVVRDNLNNTPWWQIAVNYQVATTSGKQYRACLFGDSISSALGNTLGAGTFNYALGGMSTTSLLIQLNRLVAANVRCDHALIAIGTNDAWYGHEDERFSQQLQQAIALVRNLGATQITLIPAFYATAEASKNPKLAGPLSRVDELNRLIQQLVATEKVNLLSETISPEAARGMQTLYQDQALNPSFTIDGVHLNNAGKQIYRQALLNLIQPAAANQPTNKSGS